MSDTASCNERSIRLRYKLGDIDWVKTKLENIIDNPSSDSEHDFAVDFYALKFTQKRTSDVTDILRQSSVIKLDEAYKHQPESAAIRHFRAMGYECYQAENAPWRQLFGLLFWDELYPKGTQRHIPNTLKNKTFTRRYKDQITHKLRKLDKNPKHIFVQLLQTMSQNYGQPNGIFEWKGRNLDVVKLLIMHSPQAALTKILQQMCDDYTNMKDGFPDLITLESGSLKLIEIKAEGDVLRRNQLTRIRQLRAAGYSAEVCRIEWMIDPDQIYVVVDIETTGGRAGLHRITEIGAVKVQGGEMIDSWHSLINPQRSIPPFITKLTGISEDMVADSPMFHEIADSFSDFMGDAIFVAHSVNFDYGFISAEYEMIDRKFSYPKLCTVRTMRQHFPDYKSYGLKALCERLEIRLDNHHRALDDAIAAAELLKMVNEKRMNP